jgi:predicted metal-dependent hydrolase
MWAYFTKQTSEVLAGRTMSLRIDYRKRRNARRYILRVNARGDGGCVTIPRGGSRAEARSFAQRNLVWLEETLERSREKTRAATAGNRILFRGELVEILTVTADEVLLGSQTLRLRPGAGNLRARLKMKLWELAKAELPLRLQELAAAHGLAVKRVSVRNQRSRWGSCSVKAVISLNWRLIQTPDFVRDYIMVHELMHLREMNHSARFWKLVHEAFPRAAEAERWLKAHSGLLRAGEAV